MTITVTSIDQGPFTATGLAQTVAYTFMTLTDEEISVFYDVGLGRVLIDPASHVVTRNKNVDGSAKEGGTVELAVAAAPAGSDVYLRAAPRVDRDLVWSDTGSRLKNLNEEQDRMILRLLVTNDTLSRNIDGMAEAGAAAGAISGAAAALPTVQNVIIDITKPPYNAVADYNPATGTWTTDNSAAVIAAINTGREILAPAGNFFVLDSAAHRLLERVGYSGPGRIYGGWLDGQNYAFGDVVVAGEMLPFGGDRRRGGVLIGGDKDPYGDGSLLSATEMGGPLFQPTYYTTNELNVYALIVSGTGITVNGTDRVTFTDGSSLSTGDNLVEVGDIIGFGVQGYKISAIDSTGFNVTTESGGAVVFSGAVENHFRWSYKISRGYCDTNGTAVTWNRGQYFFSFFYGSAFQRFKTGGTWRAVNAIASAKALTLGSSAGTATNTPYIMKSFFRVAAGVRPQSIFGGKEEAGFVGVSYHGRLEYDAQGYAGGSVSRKMPHSFGGATQFDGNAERFATNITADGKLGSGEDFDILLSSPARFNAKVQNATSMGSGLVRNTLARLRSFFAGDLRFVDFFFLNDYSGVNIQSRTGSGTAGTRINPEGGNVSVGTTNASSPLTVAKGGSVGVAGVGLLVDLGSGEVLRDIKFGAPGSGPGGAGRMLWTDN